MQLNWPSSRKVHESTIGSDSGQSALIIGAGPIGLAVLLCLKAFGAKTILISEIAAMRKGQAEKFGVDAVLDPTQVDVVKKAQELVDGYLLLWRLLMKHRSTCRI
jgi:threonine dehydrogenase-like Zn-dependent dehydrogenase